MKTAREFGDFGHTAKSAVCAGVACFAVFAVLPLSAFVGEPDGEESPVRVSPLRESSGAVGEAGASAQYGVRIQSLKAPPRADLAKSSAPFVPAASDLDISASAPIACAGGMDLGFAGLGGEAEIPEIFAIPLLDSRPRLIESVRIKYPREMLDRGVEGEVLLDVIIDTDGRVEVAGVISSTNPEFAHCAAEGVSKFVYETPLKNGKPVRARFALPVPFRRIK